MQQGDGALAIASWNGNLKIAKKLLQLGLDVNEPHSVRGQVIFVSLIMLLVFAVSGWLHLLTLGSCQRTYPTRGISYTNRRVD